jgi:hypothetical protein
MSSSSSFAANPLSPYTAPSSGPVEITDLSAASYSLLSASLSKSGYENDLLGIEELAAFFSVFIGLGKEEKNE